MRFPLPAKFEDGDFSTFRKSFERVAKANGWKEEEQLAALPLALGSRALLVFEEKEKTLKTIAEAWKILEEEFNSPLDKETAMKEFYAYRWGVGLDPDVYASKLKSLLKKGLPSLGDNDVDRIVINQFINGLSGSHRENLRLLFSGKSPALSEVVAASRDLIRRSDGECQVCKVEEESDLGSRINELSAGLESLTTQVNAMQSRWKKSDRFGPEERGGRNRDDWRRTKGREQVRCFNCMGFGHMARSCPSPRSARRPQSGNEEAGDRRPTANLR